MEPQARASRVELEVKGSCFGGFLLLAGQLGKAVGECVGDTEFHFEKSENHSTLLDIFCSPNPFDLLRYHS